MFAIRLIFLEEAFFSLLLRGSDVCYRIRYARWVQTQSRMDRHITLRLHSHRSAHSSKNTLEPLWRREGSFTVMLCEFFRPVNFILYMIPSCVRRTIQEIQVLCFSRRWYRGRELLFWSQHLSSCHERNEGCVGKRRSQTTSYNTTHLLSYSRADIWPYRIVWCSWIPIWYGITVHN